MPYESTAPPRLLPWRMIVLLSIFPLSKAYFSMAYLKKKYNEVLKKKNKIVKYDLTVFLKADLINLSYII